MPESQTPSVGPVRILVLESGFGDTILTNIIGHYIEPVDVRLQLYDIEAFQVPVRSRLHNGQRCPTVVIGLLTKVMDTPYRRPLELRRFLSLDRKFT